MIAYCWAGGEIHFGRRMPEGALPVAKGPARALRKEIQVVARHGYDGVTLLVPGVPEAPNENTAVDALIAFRKWAGSRKSLPAGVQYVGEGLMAAKTAKKTAKNAKQISKPKTPAAPLPAVLQVTAHQNNDGSYFAESNGIFASSHDAAPSVRRLAQKLGYSKHADVRYTHSTSGGKKHFEIVEVARAQ